MFTLSGKLTSNQKILLEEIEKQYKNGRINEKEYRGFLGNGREEIKKSKAYNRGDEQDECTGVGGSIYKNDAPQPEQSDQIEKSHKYISKKPDGKGGYNYIYTQNTDTPKKEENEYTRIRRETDEVISGTKHIERLPEEAEQGRIAGGRINVEATLLLRTSKRTDREFHEREVELNFLKKYAQETGCWVDDYEAKFGAAYRIAGATESEVYFGRDENKGYVIKVNNFSQHEQPIELMDRIAINNLYFPEATVELIGFTERDGEVNAMLKQPFIKMEKDSNDKVLQVSKESISGDMVKRGFTDRGGNMFSNDYYIIEDLHSKNVCYSQEGNIIYFDAVCRPNEVEEGYGGKLDIIKSFNTITDYFNKGIIDELTFNKAEEELSESIFETLGGLDNLQLDKEFHVDFDTQLSDLSIQLKSKEVYLDRIFDKKNKNVINFSFELKKNGTGLGLKIFERQVEQYVVICFHFVSLKY